MKMDIDKILGKEQNGSSSAQDSMKIDKSELRKRDPIGQLLDSLCNSSKEKEKKENSNQVDKALDDASAFTPFSKPRQIHSSGPKSVCSDDFHTGNDVTSWTMPMSHSYFHGYRHFYNPLDTSMLSPKNHSTVSSPGMHYPIPSSLVNHPTPYQIAYPGTQHSQNLSSFQHFAGTLPYFASRYLQTGLETFALGQKQPNSQNFDIFEKKEKAQYVSAAPRYQCEDCKKSYSTYGGLTKHKQFHCSTQQKKEFVCKFCGKSYGSLGALKMHIRTHTLPCKCKICGKAFSRPWLLQGHMRTHTGEKPFSCLHCARAFADRSNLRAHLQTHSDVKKYACKSCSKTFSRMSLLIKHRENNNCV